MGALCEPLGVVVRYTVPEYQRPYLWEPKFVWKLLNDMWEAYLGNDKFAGDFKFLGIIIILS